jgi:hypothetical protein
MKVGIMQPYMFPYLGYFSLIKHTDLFILLDNVQYIRHGWIERNRILKQDSGWFYLKVPLIKDNGQKTLIKDIRIDNKQAWKQKILAQIKVYKKTGMFYPQIFQLMDNLLSNSFDNIVSFNLASLNAVCDYLGIRTDIRIFSEMNLTIEKPSAADEWALNICKALGDVDEYWNAPGGKEFFNKDKYERAGIRLRFHQVKLNPYPQQRQEFVPGLSIIDVLMFNTKEHINGMLDNYKIT